MKKTNIIHSRRCWLQGSLQEASIYIEDGVISDIHLGPPKSAENLFNFGNKVIMPGAIDAHVHINEPGRTDWEGFETATKSAAAGGITTIIDMPLNSSPVVTDIKALKKKEEACKGKLFVNCGFWGGAIDGKTNEIRALIEEGCLGIKVFLSHSGIDEFPNIALEDLEKVMKGIQDLNVPILAHCELDTLPSINNLKESPSSYQTYLKTRPKLWENEAIKAFINLSEKHNCKAHIVHLASDEMIEWIDEKKKQGIPFTVETCPHYLLFNAEEIADGSTIYKCAPPIRAKQNGLHLKQALKNGIINFISSDHSPAPPELKEIESGNFEKAWGGIAGLQFLLSASWTALRTEMSLEEFIPLLTSKPAKFLGLEHRIGTLKKGYDADMTIWEPEQSFEVRENQIQHRHKITPYLNQRLFGKIHTTFVNGVIAFQKETLIKSPHGCRIKTKEKIEWN